MLPGTHSTDRRQLCWGLLGRRECVVPTWRGWLIIIALGIMAAAIAVRGAYPFLAVNAPLSSESLVMEGWTADTALPQVISEFRHTGYRALFVTGGRIEGSNLSSREKTYAESGASRLRQLGFDSSLLHAIPALRVEKDRTYASAIALKTWLLARGPLPATLDVATGGPHARRTRLLFQKAFGPETRIGIISLRDTEYDPEHWWRSSIGVRTMVGEVTAYLYARVFFRPK